MTSKTPRVVVTRKLPDRIETRLRELFDARLNRDDRPLTAAELAEAVAQADVLVPTVTDRISAAVIGAAGPRLRLIASFGTGVDHIDLDAAKARGILVANTPGVLTEDTADTTMALILAVMRRLTEGERLVRAGEWEGWSPTSMLGHRPAGKKLAIVGMGRIGMAVARRARAFGMSIHYHNRRRLPPEREAEVGATWWESLDQMLVQADVVSTFHLLSARRLALMRPHAYLVNTARGEVVDEAALVRALERRELAGAGLDVYAREPAIDRRLLALDNVVCLPHMGSATLEGRIAMGERVLINIRAFADGHAVPDRVVGTGF
jgi:glyoxylate reductase